MRFMTGRNLRFIRDAIAPSRGASWSALVVSGYFALDALGIHLPPHAWTRISPPVDWFLVAATAAYGACGLLITAGGRKD